MRKFLVLAAAAALGTLSACDLSGGGNEEENTSSNVSSQDNESSDGDSNTSADEDGKDGARESGSDEGTETASAGGEVDSEWIVGKWTDDGNCRNAVEFFRSGQFVTSDGAEGRWTLEGRSLILTGSSATVLRLERADDNRMNVTNQDGSTGSSTRC